MRPMLDQVTSDLVLALRGIRAAPAIPLAAVLTTSLAVAINLAMAGLIDRALLSPPAHVAHPQQIFTVGYEVRSASGDKGIASTASYLTYDAIERRVTNINIAAWHPVSSRVSVDNRSTPVTANGVTGNYFDMLGVHATLGRVLVRSDDRVPVGAPVAVLGHSLWRSAFNGDPRAIGRTIRFGSLSVEVVGVMPAGFSGHTSERVDLWLPLSTSMHDTPGWHREARMSVVEVGVRSDERSTEAIATEIAAAAGTPIVLTPIVGADFAPQPYRIAMWLTGLSLVVLLAGLANGATLFLVRNARRRRELHIRAAMGASRGRLLGQLVIEAAIVAIAATATALLLASWFDELVRRVLFPTLVERAGVNPAVMLAAAIGGASTFVVGLVSSALQLPAQVSAEDLVDRRGPWRRSGIQRELLIAQATLAVLLITGSGMFARSYIRMASERHESQLTDVLVVAFEDGPASMRDQNQVLTAAIDRLRTVTGVDAATVFAVLPFGGGIHRAGISVAGVDDPRLDGRLPSLIEATPQLFDILRIDIVAGRGLRAEDDRGAPVVVVSETMARAIWPGANAIGKCVRIDWPFAPAPNAPSPCREVVGIARDWRREVRPGAPRDMHYYVPFARAVSTPQGMAPWPMAEGILIRQRSNAPLSVDDIRAAVTNGRTDLPFLSVRSYPAVAGLRLAHWVTGMRLLSIFGALALATAALGLYAAFAHAVAERRREIAIRLAVGASRRNILTMILREGAGLAGRGAINGIVVATLAGWVARSMLFGLSSPGVVVSAISLSLVLAAALLAILLPARAASNADPGELLRVE